MIQVRNVAPVTLLAWAIAFGCLAEDFTSRRSSNIDIDCAVKEARAYYKDRCSSPNFNFADSVPCANIDGSISIPPFVDQKINLPPLPASFEGTVSTISINIQGRQPSLPDWVGVEPRAIFNIFNRCYTEQKASYPDFQQYVQHMRDMRSDLDEAIKRLEATGVMPIPAAAAGPGAHGAATPAPMPSTP